jgi:integral membrane sensor domain MASE1
MVSDGLRRSPFGDADRVRFSLIVLGVVAGYAIGAELSWGLFGADFGLAFFPPAGITFAAFAVSSRRRWPLLAVALAVVEYSVDVRHGLGRWAAAGYATANVVEPAVGATVAIRLVGKDALRRLDERRGMAGLVVGGVLAGPLVASIFGATTKVLDTSGSSWWVSALGFWAGDALGVLVIATPLLLASRSRWKFLLNRPFEAGVNIAVTLVSSIVLFDVVHVPVMYIVILPLIWAAFRADALKLAIGGAIVATVANMATAANHGPFASIESVSPSGRLAVAKVFLATILLVSWFFLIEAKRARRGDVEHQALALLRESVLPPDALEVSDLRVVARYRPAEQLFALGGDWYDVITLGDGDIVLVVGDVVGGGLSAGLTMAQLRSAFRVIAGSHSPAEVLNRIDRFVVSVPGAFGASCACLRLSPTTGRFSVAVAGHPPPVVVSAQGLAAVVDVRPGPPLGVGGPRAVTTGLLRTEDTIVLYTDGLVERRGELIDDGIARLRTALAAQDLRDPVWPDVVIRDCLDGVSRRDDVALLACQLGNVLATHAPDANGTDAHPTALPTG